LFVKKTSVFLLALLTIAFISTARPQELGTAVLNGDVVDPSGAVVSGAQVTAKQVATGLERTATSTNAGLFVFNTLTPGDYEVHVKASGFSESTNRIRLEVGQQANLKIRLTVEKQQTEIEINDEQAIPLVNTVSSVVDGVVSSHQIDNLPLNGRNFLELALLLPGNTQAPNFDPTKQNTVVISSAGQLGRGSSVTIDGTNNDDAVGGMLLNIPEDAVQEFQMATNRFSAELGRTASGVANVVTKSGTNTLHGSASVYARDKALQALPSTFDPATTGGETPPFRREQYSGTLGGPIVRDKAWWFAGFEYRDQLGGILAGTRDVEAQTITRSFARAPLSNTLGTIRGDWAVSSRDSIALRYSIDRIEATGSSAANASFGSDSQRQDLRNNFQSFLSSWTRVFSPRVVNRFSFSVNNFFNSTDPVVPGPQLDFPTMTDGASFRVPQQTWQNRFQWDDGVDWTIGRHNLRFGGQFQRLDDKFYLGVFQGGRIQFVQDFANQDRNGDGVINDEDLLFAVTIRSATPDRALVLPNCDNNYIAGYIQDDWHIHPQLTLNLGLRYEVDTDVNNVGRYNEINPIVLPLLKGKRKKDLNNFGPRIGFNWATPGGKLSVHGGYGIYYDRITLEIESLERGLDGRALAIVVRAGNAIPDPTNTTDPPTKFFYLNDDGTFKPDAPTFSNAFIGFPFPGAGAAAGIDIIDNNIQNPMIQQFNLGVQFELANNWVIKADGIHNLGTHFIIGRPIGSVINPDIDGGTPEGVTNLESSVNTHYDALWLSVDKRLSRRYQIHGAYTLSKSLNYANDDQIPFAYPPVDPNDLHREYGPAPNDQRHRFVIAAIGDLPWGIRVSPYWTYASGVPMDILLGDGSNARVPQLGRNAGGRQFHNAAELNAVLTTLGLPLVDSNARFNDTFNSFDLRISKEFKIKERMAIQVLGEVFNLANKTNILGTSTTNYSGFFNALVPDQGDPSHSSAFGKPVSTAGGVFGSGGPRAFQLAAKLTF